MRIVPVALSELPPPWLDAFELRDDLVLHIDERDDDMRPSSESSAIAPRAPTICRSGRMIVSSRVLLADEAVPAAPVLPRVVHTRGEAAGSDTSTAAAFFEPSLSSSSSSSPVARRAGAGRPSCLGRRLILTASGANPTLLPFAALPSLPPATDFLFSPRGMKTIVWVLSAAAAASAAGAAAAGARAEERAQAR